MSVFVPCFVIRLRVLLSTVDPSFRKTRIVRVLFFFLLLLGRACESTRKERLLDVAYRKRKKKKFGLKLLLPAIVSRLFTLAQGDL